MLKESGWGEPLDVGRGWGASDGEGAGWEHGGHSHILGHVRSGTGESQLQPAVWGPLVSLGRACILPPTTQLCSSA